MLTYLPPYGFLKKQLIFNFRGCFNLEIHKINFIGRNKLANIGSQNLLMKK